MATHVQLATIRIGACIYFPLADSPRDTVTMQMVSLHSFRTWAFAENQAQLAIKRVWLNSLSENEQQAARFNRTIVDAIHRGNTAG